VPTSVTLCVQHEIQPYILQSAALQVNRTAFHIPPRPTVLSVVFLMNLRHNPQLRKTSGIGVAGFTLPFYYYGSTALCSALVAFSVS
jgi:hypothetical protein